MYFKYSFGIFVVFFLFIYPQTLNAASFHAPPNCWDKERIYHLENSNAQDILQVFPKHMAVERSTRTLPEEINLSPNQSYAYFLEQTADDFIIHIFTERSYLTVIRLRDIHGMGGIDWINEKLLLIRVWLGRIAGVDIFFDVEDERILYRMPFRWGGIEYNQWKEACENPYGYNQGICSNPCYSIH